MSRYLCDARLFDVGSFSDATKVYRVVIPTDPAVASSCTCKASTYRPGDCKHIQNVKWAMEDDGIPELLGPPTVLGTGFSIKDIGQLFQTALTWVNDDADRAAGLVEAYLKGARGEGL